MHTQFRDMNARKHNTGMWTLANKQENTNSTSATVCGAAQGHCAHTWYTAAPTPTSELERTYSCAASSRNDLNLQGRAQAIGIRCGTEDFPNIINQMQAFMPVILVEAQANS